MAFKTVFTTGEAARICKVSQQTIIRCFDSGALKGFHVPGSRFRRIPRECLLAFMKENNIPTDALESGKRKILIVDDEPRILLLLQSLLKANGYDVETARDGDAAIEVVRKGGVDITVTDLRMTPMDGMTLFRELKAISPSMPVILLTAYASVETAIDAMKSGIFDYLTKPFKVDDMIACLKRAEEQLAKSDTRAAQVERPSRYRFENLIGASPLMTQVCDMIQKVAPTAATVLINGESGTGKEVIARTIHKNSPRAGKPWVAVNCAALPENLLESEMFGHMKGSFTGAYSDKQGLFEVANGGTLFLDEISSMPLLLQGKLLRVLQEREIRRVGGTKDIPVDVRIIATVNEDPEELLEKHLIRRDLFYRIAVIRIDIPPLRERKDDIVLLAEKFLEKYNEKYGRTAWLFSEKAKEKLLSYDYPGNVRELENIIMSALSMFEPAEHVVGEDDLVINRRKSLPAQNVYNLGDGGLDAYLAKIEREMIENALVSSGGNITKAAESLKIKRQTLQHKIRKYQQEP